MPCAHCNNPEMGFENSKCPACNVTPAQKRGEEPVPLIDEARFSIKRGDKGTRWQSQQVDYLRAIALLLLAREEREYELPTDFNDILKSMGLG